MIISIELDLEIGKPLVEDKLQEVLDYDFIIEGIKALIAKQRYNLQESLCEDILQLCLAQHKVLGAKVQTCKPDAYEDAAGICYELTASKA